jgi:hypothetical protein
VKIVSRSTSAERMSAAAKFWSFSRKAQSLATHKSSLSRHQPVYRGSPSGAAVLGVLDFDEPPAPACRQGGRAEVDAVGAEPVEFLERGEFSGDAFDEVREALGLSLDPPTDFVLAVLVGEGFEGVFFLPLTVLAACRWFLGRGLGSGALRRGGA